MTTLWNARSVDPDTVTDADLAAICDEFDIDTDDFFQTGQTYRRHGDTFHCAAVGMNGDAPIAIGYLPVVLGGQRVWEFGAMTGYDWRWGWTKVEG